MKKLECVAERVKPVKEKRLSTWACTVGVWIVNIGVSTLVYLVMYLDVSNIPLEPDDFP